MKRVFFFSLIVLTLISSCTEWGILRDNTRITKKYEELKPFKNVLLDGIYDVEIYQRDDEKLIVEGTENQISKTDIYIENDTLFIKSLNTDHWVSNYERMKLSIYVNEINRIKSVDPITFKTVDTLRSKYIAFYLYGDLCNAEILVNVKHLFLKNLPTAAGNFDIKGRTNSATIIPGGSAPFDAKGLSANNIRLLQYSSANAYVNVRNRLEVITRASGNVYYIGNPKDIILEQEASGQVYPYSETN
jgi:hypothetical protein